MNIGNIFNKQKSAGTISIFCYDWRQWKFEEIQRWQNKIVREYYEGGSFDIQRGGGILPLIIGNKKDFLNDIALHINESPEVLEGKAYFDVIILLHSLCKAYNDFKKRKMASTPNIIWNERNVQIKHIKIGAEIIQKKFGNAVRIQGWRGEFLDPDGRKIKFEKII